MNSCNKTPPFHQYERNNKINYKCILKKKNKSLKTITTSPKTKQCNLYSLGSIGESPICAQNFETVAFQAKAITQHLILGLQREPNLLKKPYFNLQLRQNISKEKQRHGEDGRRISHSHTHNRQQLFTALSTTKITHHHYKHHYIMPTATTTRRTRDIKKSSTPNHPPNFLFF